MRATSRSPSIADGLAEHRGTARDFATAAGKASGAGHTFAYTPTDVPAYGTDYTLRLAGARAQPRRPQATAPVLPTFETQFSTRDRAFAYLGTEGEATGRLILRNETRDETVDLTPIDLVVTNFEPYSDGDRILFSAYERNRGNGIADQQLYTVSTGLGERANTPPGRVQLLLSSAEYQNLQFDLAENGEFALVQRVNRQNRADSGLWLLPIEGEPRALGVQGDRFTLTPDGRAVAIARERGVEIVPFVEAAGTWEFFPGYQRLLAFAPRDRQTKLLVRENDDFTESLYLVDRQGKAVELLQTRGQLLDCQFEPRQETHLYCLHTEPLAADSAIVSPFLTLVELATAESVPLVALTDDPNVRMSLSPDGRDLLFDQVVRPVETEDTGQVLEPSEIVGSLWRMPLPDLSGREAYVNFSPPEEVGAGVDPHWLP
ncbi:MAG: hypothetical protein HC838_00425 [Spirulinaceae cyanobacterium RM2_2_10]|nr:hypothetical protein [Spirulinaceae cyanobacterium RM2_2_10]